MVQGKLSAQEFIKNAFTPNIAILQSLTVDKICLKNNLTFVQLLQPFSTLNTDVLLQDGNGDVITIPNFKVSFKSATSQSLQPALINKILNSSVSNLSEIVTENIEESNYNLQNIPTSTPWFESWRTTFLKLQYVSDHEFTKHYLACIMVISSKDDNPMEIITQLEQKLSGLQTTYVNKSSKWFNSSTLRYYCILHDKNDGNDNKAGQFFESFNVSFGSNNCFLLEVNSRKSKEIDQVLTDPWNKYLVQYCNSMPNNQYTADMSSSLLKGSTGQTFGNENTLPYHPLCLNTEFTNVDETMIRVENTALNISLHGAYLTTEDIDQIKLFVHDFCTKALIPHVERLIQNINDMLINRKGVGKSLFSATKRWFTPGKTVSTNGASNLLIYPHDSPELWFRQLGDIYFMFGCYNMAYQIYHACKQDFYADQAWFYYAGVLEMASLAAFMGNEPTRKSFEYIEEAISTYLNTCKASIYATRATLFSTECLKGCNFHGEAAHQFIRMTGEESDLRSALFLEQAAVCFLENLRPRMARKYAFHMVLAGHRYSKSAQKKHALRCYKQALQIFRNTRWAFAEDHIHYTIGKLSTFLNNYEEAIHSLGLLLTVQSKQSVEQQTLFLEEYLSIHRMLLNNQTSSQSSSVLLVPILKSETLKILVGPTPPLSIPRKVRALGMSFDSHNNPVETQMWNKLEEMIIQEAQGGSLSITFKAPVMLYTQHNIFNTKVSAVVNELIQVSVIVHNPLSVPLILQGVYLLWKFKDVNGVMTTNDSIDGKSSLLVKTHILKSFLAQSNNSQDLILSITPLIMGYLEITGIFYSIYNSYNSEDIVFVVGKQYFDIVQLGLPAHSNFEIQITPPAPCLQVTFSEIRSEVLCGEIQLIQMEIRNAGHVSLNKVYIATSKPEYLSTCEFYNKCFSFNENDVDNSQEQEAVKNHVCSVPLPNGSLDPGQIHLVNIWLKAPCFIGSFNIDLLIYYANLDGSDDSRYRLIRHTWLINTCKSVEISFKVIDSYSALQNSEFIVTITNANTSHHNLCTKISLANVTLLSRLWKLESLGKCTRPIALNSKQTMQLLLKGIRCVTDSKNCYEVCMDDYQSHTTGIVLMDFGQRYGQNIVNTFEMEQPYWSQKLEGVLLFHWAAEVTTTTGHEYKTHGQTCVGLENFHHFYKDSQQRFNKIDSILVESHITEIGAYTPADKLHRQILLYLIYDDFVYHDFALNGVCIVPIKIVLYNNATVNSVITMSTISTGRSSKFLSNKQLIYNGDSSKSYGWVGMNTITKSASSSSFQNTTFYIAVASPGVYDLESCFEVWCQNELHSEQVVQFVESSSFITIENVQN